MYWYCPLLISKNTIILQPCVCLIYHQQEKDILWCQKCFFLNSNLQWWSHRHPGPEWSCTMAQISAISTCVIGLNWEFQQDVTFKMAELHAHHVLQLYSFCFMWKTAGNMLKLFHPVLYDMYFISHYHCYCVLSQLAVKIAEWFASVVDPNRHLRQITFHAKGNFTLGLIRTKSFQIGLNHWYYVFGNSSTLYYIIALAFTAFLV